MFNHLFICFFPSKDSFHLVAFVDAKLLRYLLVTVLPFIHCCLQVQVKVIGEAMKVQIV